MSRMIERCKNLNFLGNKPNHSLTVDVTEVQISNLIAGEIIQQADI